MTVTMVGGASVSRSAYVPGFDEDLFISYGHLDNARGGGSTPCTSNSKTRLNELLGTTDVRIWRDRRLDGADAFEDVLRQKVSKSALLLSVFSPRYVTSASCTKEVDWFVEAARTQGGIRVDTKARLIRVLKTPLQGAPEPPSLREVDTLGFRFYEERGDDFTEFSADPALPGHAEFQQQCEKLAKAINHLLRRMREARRLVERVERPKVIFLAETTKDLKQARESVRQELSDGATGFYPRRRSRLTIEPSWSRRCRRLCQSAMSPCTCWAPLMELCRSTRRRAPLRIYNTPGSGSADRQVIFSS